MTIWDKLWAEMPVVVYGLRGGKSTHAEWLTKIKAEGDRLQAEDRKATQVLKNWEHYFGEVDSINYNSSQMKAVKEKAEKFDKLVALKPSERLLEYMTELRECEKKLEAIKMVCDALSFKYDFIEDIKEILEGEG